MKKKRRREKENKERGEKEKLDGRKGNYMRRTSHQSALLWYHVIGQERGNEIPRQKCAKPNNAVGIILN